MYLILGSEGRAAIKKGTKKAAGGALGLATGGATKAAGLGVKAAKRVGKAKIVHRQTEKVKGKVEGVKSRIKATRPAQTASQIYQKHLAPYEPPAKTEEMKSNAVSGAKRKGRPALENPKKVVRQ